MTPDYKAMMNVAMAVLCVLAIFAMWQTYDQVKQNNELLEKCDVQEIITTYCGSAGLGGTIGGMRVNMT